MPGVPEGGPRRCVDAGSSRVPAAARVEARPPVSSSSAADATTAPAIAAAAAAESNVESIYWSLCQLGNERIQFVLGIVIFLSHEPTATTTPPFIRTHSSH